VHFGGSSRGSPDSRDGATPEGPPGSSDSEASDNGYDDYTQTADINLSDFGELGTQTIGKDWLAKQFKVQYPCAPDAGWMTWTCSAAGAMRLAQRQSFDRKPRSVER